MGDLREVRRLVAEVEAPSPELEPLYPLASSVDASSASAAAAALFPEKGTLRLRGGGEGAVAGSTAGPAAEVRRLVAEVEAPSPEP